MKKENNQGCGAFIPNELSDNPKDDGWVYGQFYDALKKVILCPKCQEKEGCGKEGMSGEGEHLVCGEGILCDECSKESEVNEVGALIEMKKENKSLREELEELFGEAYEIGHAHGRGDNKYIDIGWHKPFKKAIKIFKEKVQNAQKRLKEEIEERLQGLGGHYETKGGFATFVLREIDKIFLEEFGRKLI